MLAVFLAISYIADKYFNLKQTSKTFFYIALAYIPITLLSISMFSLFGNFLSLYGDGKYIYLTFSSVLVSYIYHITSIKYKNKPIFIFNMMFQLLSIIFFISIFTNNTSIIFCGLFIYSIIISLLYLKDKIYFDKDLHLKLSNILFICLSSFLVLNNLVYIGGACDDLNRLAARLQTDADVAIGSRYVRGVNVVNWPLGRLLMSYFASKYVKIVTRMPVCDATAGFVGYRAQVLRKINLDRVQMIGYGFQIEMKYTAWRHGFNIAEESIIFVDREQGTSKMSSSIFGEAFFGVLKLPFRRLS